MKKILLIGFLCFTMAFAEENTISSSTYDDIKEQIKNNKALMIEFGADSCRSCLVMKERLYNIKKEYVNSNIFYLNIYKQQEAAKFYNLRMIPTQIFLNEKGEILETHLGVLTEDEILLKLKKYKILN